MANEENNLHAISHRLGFMAPIIAHGSTAGAGSRNG
jgi:hypothetical protein